MSVGQEPKIFRILSLDGGGAKGFYTIGVLKGIEGMLGGGRLDERFDLVFGTSTGSIIAALICLGRSIDEIHDLYREHVVKVMSKWLPGAKSSALTQLASDVFEQKTFQDVRTNIGLVATNWDFRIPTIFKNSVNQAHGDRENFVAGFGCKIGDAVQASCSAFPFFRKKTIITSQGQKMILVDGGYCANNPELYAIADAVAAFGVPLEDIRLVTIGVGEYPAPRRYLSLSYWIGYWFTVRLLQRVLEINTKSMEQLRKVLFGNVQTVRISQTYAEPEMAADLFEADLDKLDKLYQRGRQSYRDHEAALRAFF
jgi:patatin-like phospholipase/acyl hydrolase